MSSMTEHKDGTRVFTAMLAGREQVVATVQPDGTMDATPEEAEDVGRALMAAGATARQLREQALTSVREEAAAVAREALTPLQLAALGIE